MAQDNADPALNLTRYRACPVVGEPAPDRAFADPDAWVNAGSMRDRHVALRGRHGVALPPGERQILLFEDLDHHHHVSEASWVATRTASGRWAVDAIIEYADGRVVRKNRTLSEADSRTLNRELLDDCLVAEPRRSAYSEIELSTESRWTVEINEPDRSLVFERQNGGFGHIAWINYVLTREQPQ